MQWNTTFLTAPNPYAALRRDFDRSRVPILNRRSEP